MLDTGIFEIQRHLRIFLFQLCQLCLDVFGGVLEVTSDIGQLGIITGTIFFNPVAELLNFVRQLLDNASVTFQIRNFELLHEHDEIIELSRVVGKILNTRCHSVDTLCECNEAGHICGQT